MCVCVVYECILVCDGVHMSVLCPCYWACDLEGRESLVVCLAVLMVVISMKKSVPVMGLCVLTLSARHEVE